MTTEVASPWKEALRSRRFVCVGVATLGVLIAVLSTLNRFLQYNELRPGVTLRDPILDVLPARDLSLPLFMLIYGTLIATLTNLARRPRPLLVALQAYALLACFRMIMMFTIPLEQPPGMIMLVDPFVRSFGDGPNWAKDLFFSGHTSTTFLCALCVQSRALRAACLGACLSVAVLILVQHAHYTIDVLVAPFVAFGSYHLAREASARALGH